MVSVGESGFMIFWGDLRGTTPGSSPLPGLPILKGVMMKVYKKTSNPLLNLLLGLFIISIPIWLIVSEAKESDLIFYAGFIIIIIVIVIIEGVTSRF